MLWVCGAGGTDNFLRVEYLHSTMAQLHGGQVLPELHSLPSP